MKKLGTLTVKTTFKAHFFLNQLALGIVINFYIQKNQVTD